MNKSYKELLRATKGIFEDDDYSKNIRMKFHRENDTIGIFTEDIDNCYDKEEGSRWEIFLNKDGTWRIN